MPKFSRTSDDLIIHKNQGHACYLNQILAGIRCACGFLMELELILTELHPFKLSAKKAAKMTIWGTVQ